MLVTYLLVRRLTGGPWFGLAAALLMAVDPRSIEWSSPVRMYALLQLLTVALAWATVRLVDEPSGRAAALVVLLGWLAVYTTVLGTLLFPGVLAGAAIALLRSRPCRRLLVGLTAGLAAAPLSFIALNRLLAPDEAVSDGGTGGSAGFVGDHLISTRPDWSPSPTPWLDLWSGWLREQLAVLLGVAALVLLVRWLGRGRDGAGRVMLVVCYWLPVAAILAFVRAPESRYLVNLQPLGVSILVVAVADLLRPASRRARAGDWIAPGPLFAALLALAVLVTSSSTVARGATHLNRHRTRGSDLLNASRYVAAHHVPGETVLVSLPPPMYLALGSDRDIVFASGRTASRRTALYTRRTDQGLEDFWIGSPVVTTGPQVCALLVADPRAWVVVDLYQLASPNALRGSMANAILALTTEERPPLGGVIVRRARPDAALLAPTFNACRG